MPTPQVYEDTQFVAGCNGVRPPLESPVVAAAGPAGDSPRLGAAADQQDRTAFMSENVAPALHVLHQQAAAASPPPLDHEWDVPDDEQVHMPSQCASEA